MAYGLNILTGGTASADTDQSGVHPASNAVDGNLTTYWASDGTEPHWWEYDLGAGVTKIVQKCSIYRLDGYIIGFTIQGSNNGSAWDNLATPTASAGNGWEDYMFVNQTAYRYYRLYFTVGNGGYNAAYEIQMFELLSIGFFQML